MISNQSNKRRVESFVVNDDTGNAAALYNTAGSGNALTDTTTGDVVLGDGQIGIFAVSAYGTVAPYVATDTTPTILEAPVIAFFQGTGSSADPGTPLYGFPLVNRPFEKTGDIDGRQQFTARYQAYQAPTYDCTIVGYDGTDGAVNVLDNTEYVVKLGFRGRIIDEFYNPEGTAVMSISTTTPDFTTLGTTEPADWIIQYQTWGINRNSSAINVDRPSMRGHYPVVAFALDTTSTAGTNANALSTGYFPVVNTVNGTRGITLTAAHITSIQNALSAAGMPADTGVLTIDLATAGTATGGAADAYLVMGLDRRLAYVDRVPQIKTRVDVGLSLGYDVDVVNNAKWEEAFEGQGTGRQLSLLYSATQGQRKYNLRHTLDPVIEYPNPIVTTTNYSVFTIEHFDSNQIDTFNVSVSPQKSYICIPSSESTLITAVTTALNAFAASGTNQNVQTS